MAFEVDGEVWPDGLVSEEEILALHKRLAAEHKKAVQAGLDVEARQIHSVLCLITAALRQKVSRFHGRCKVMVRMLDGEVADVIDGELVPESMWVHYDLASLRALLPVLTDPSIAKLTIIPLTDHRAQDEHGPFHTWKELPHEDVVLAREEFEVEGPVCAYWRQMARLHGTSNESLKRHNNVMREELLKFMDERQLAILLVEPVSS